MDKDIYNIISDYFRKQISAVNLEYLENWKTQSADNAKLFEELGKVWEITGELSTSLEPDVDAEWDNFVKERNNTAKNNGKIRKLNPFLRIAAILIPAFIILSVTFIYLKNSNSTEPQITIITKEEKKECTLPDGSQVWINRHSTFTYPEEFANNERKVSLQGEAFFEITKNKSPFKIISGKTEVVVVGTAFNVRAIEQEKFVEVTVNEGTVIFRNTLSNNSTILVQGEKGTYNENTNEIKKETLDDYNAIAWKSEQLIFNDSPLSEIGIVLSRYFNIEVQIDSALEQCNFTGDFKKPQLDEVLKVISISLGADFAIENNIVLIKGKGCIN